MYLRKSTKEFKTLGASLTFTEMNARRQALFMDTHNTDPAKAMAVVCTCVDEWADKTPDELLEELSIPMLTEVSSAIFALSGLNLSEVEEEKKPLEDSITGASSSG